MFSTNQMSCQQMRNDKTMIWSGSRHNMFLWMLFPVMFIAHFKTEKPVWAHQTSNKSPFMLHSDILGSVYYSYVTCHYINVSCILFFNIVAFCNIYMTNTFYDSTFDPPISRNNLQFFYFNMFTVLYIKWTPIFFSNSFDFKGVL